MEKNTSRERVRKTLEHNEPDMIPIDFGGEHTRIHPIAHKKLKKFLGYEEDIEGKATLAAQDIRFARTIERLQRIVLSELNKIDLVHLYTPSYTDETLINFIFAISS